MLVLPHIAALTLVGKVLSLRISVIKFIDHDSISRLINLEIHQAMKSNMKFMTNLSSWHIVHHE